MLRCPLKWVGVSPMHKQMMEEYADRHGIAFGDRDDDEVGGDREGWTVIAPPGPAALAEQAARLGLAEYRAGRALGAEALRAIYVRPSDAELNER